MPLFDCSNTVDLWRGRWSHVGLAGCCLIGSVAQAQQHEAIPLKDSVLLQERIDAAHRAILPTFISGDQITGQPDLQTVIQGNAMLRKGDLVIKADRLDYNQATDLARAQGHVQINRAGNVYAGPLLELKVDAFEGFFTLPTYRFLRNQAHGQAQRVDFLDDQRAVIHDASFTTCQRSPNPDWLPDWILRATQLRIDNADNTGTAEGALLSFKGVPLLPVPYLSFPLNDERKSGLLPPTLGFDTVNGTEFAQPYYWNIAPNRDATFTPTLMSKRGLNLGSEFRYLEPDYNGTARLDWMPGDSLRDRSRWGVNLAHQGRLLSDAATGPVTLRLSLNRVSDDDYWRDFNRTNGSLTQRLLANDAALSWNNGPFSSSLRALSWQTLQDVSAPIVPPYDRLPQLSTRYAGQLGAGLQLLAQADYTRFVSDSDLTGQPNGQRALLHLDLSRRWQTPGGYLLPKLQLHATRYQFDTPLSNGVTQANRVLPTLSVDSGLVFERDTSLFGRALRQTLEPRVFYVNTPYQDQSLLPNYDSGAHDFSLATIYSENAFVGHDRISDSHRLTLGVTSRYLHPQTGAEVIRLGVAQRVQLRDQNVSLPGVAPVQGRISDVLLAGSVHWDPRWRVDAAVQYNPHTARSERSTLSANYSPSSYRTVSVGYRYQRQASEQLDIGWQWPLGDLAGAAAGSASAPASGLGAGRWYSVGRLNYSMMEHKWVDSILGLEYDAGCWLGRLVFERLQTSTSSATQRVMFQLEFVGFSRLGVNALKSLKDHIPNYQNLRGATPMPSRFSQYD